MLRIQGLKKSFGGIRAVDGCTFEISPHTITALIGPNGAGKTTLFNCVTGVVPIDSGTVQFAGHDITRLPFHARAQLGISRTFQLVRVFANMTVEENLRLAAEPRDQDFWRALFLPHTVANQNVGRGVIPRRGGAQGPALQDILNLVGLDQPLSYPAKSLSYGQSKLLSLARALLMPHKILMLDEPVAGVAPHLREHFKQLLPELKKRATLSVPNSHAERGGETIFFIEHDMDFVRTVADHVIVMDQGRVLIQGTLEQVLKDKRVLDAYLGEQL